MDRIVHLTAPAKPREPHEGTKPRGPAPPPPPRWRSWLLYVGLLLTLFLLFRPSMSTGGVTTLTYTQWRTDVTQDRVRTATIDPDGRVSGKLQDGADYRSQIPVALQDN